jgi:hypothetical protein
MIPFFQYWKLAHVRNWFTFRRPERADVSTDIASHSEIDTSPHSEIDISPLSEIPELANEPWMKAAELNDWDRVVVLFDATPPSKIKEKGSLWYLWYARAAIRQRQTSSLERAWGLVATLSESHHIRRVITKEIDESGFLFAGTRIIDTLPKIAPDIEEIEKSRQYSQVSIVGSNRVRDDIFTLFHEMNHSSQIQDIGNHAYKVLQFDNVYANRIGQIWDASGKILHGPKNRGSSNFAGGTHPPHLREAILVTNGTKGFFHWYVEAFPALAWALQNGGSNLPILFGDHKAHFQDETLALYLGFMPDIRRISDAVNVDRLFVCEGSLRQLAQRNFSNSVYDSIVTAARKKSNDFSLGRKIYISRRKARRRTMHFEENLEARLKDLGFITVCLEDYSIAEQISLIRHANIVVASHGAGLSHIAAAKPGLKVFEIMPTDIAWTLRRGKWNVRFYFARISRMMGHTHRLWLEYAHPMSRQWQVSPDEIAKAVTEFIGSDDDDQRT